MIAVAIVVAMLLHWLVTPRGKMVEVSKYFAADMMHASICVDTTNWPTCHAFDDMASQRNKAQRRSAKQAFTTAA